MNILMEETEFYNGGDAQSMRMVYDNPDGPKHAISYYLLNAPKQGFFKIPRQMPTPYGGQVLVDFVQQAIEKFGDRGFVAIVAGNDFPEQIPYASSKEDAKTKGTKNWKTYCRTKIQEFDDENEKRVSEGRVKMKPSGFVVHAHKELGIAVPNEDVYKTAEIGQSALAQMQEAMAKQQKQIEELLAAKSPEEAPKGARK